MTERGYRPVVFLITGERGGGKTTALREVLDILRGQGLKIAGIVTPGTVKNGMRHSFTVCDVMTGRGVSLASVVPHEGWKQIGSYYFSPAGLSHGFRALSPDRVRGADIIVIDEIGHFELRGNMWADSVDNLTKTADIPMIWVVRRWIIDQVITRWKLQNPVILDIAEFSIDEIAESVKKIYDMDESNEM